MAISRMNMERQLRNMGGIMTLEEPRQGYFLGKLVRKAKKAVKKVVKSPVGKAAILGALTFGIPGTQFGGLAGGKGLAGLKGKLFGTAASKAAGPFGYLQGSPFTKGLFGKLGLTTGGGSMGLTGLGKIAGITGLSGLAGLMAKGAVDEEDETDLSKLDRGEGLNIADIVARARKNDPEFRFLPGAEFTGTYAEGGEVDTVVAMIKDMLNKGMDDDTISGVTGASQEQINSVKTAQAEGKAEGGIMNLGGLEMDLRGGGFVPIGAKESMEASKVSLPTES